MEHISISFSKEIRLSIVDIIFELQNKRFEVALFLGSIDLLVFEQNIQMCILFIQGINLLKKSSFFIR